MSSFASLHGGLLVRKGEAAPSAAKPAIVHGHGRDPFAAQRRDVLQADKQRPVTERPATEHSARAASAAPRAETLSDDRDVRATLRLTREQLRRLRLASAMLEQSQQDLLSRALDDRLDELAEGLLRNCRCFRRGGGKVENGCAFKEDSC